jgi:citrate lyase beta subunit
MSTGASPPRSWLFVPADSNRKMMKALASAADAVIFDLEDSVAPSQKALARELLGLLPERRDREPERWVRINPIGTDAHGEDLEVLDDLAIDGIVLPKCESGDDVADFCAAFAPKSLPVHAIVTETAASLFGLLSYREAGPSLAAMSWGAEDLSAALGASSKYAANGDLAFTYKLARSLCLAGAEQRRDALGVHAVRHLAHEMIADDHMIGVAALADRSVVIVGAVVGLDAALAAEDFPAFQALVALHAAVDHATDRDRVADAVAGDLVADCGDGTDDLVARDDRIAGAAPVVAAGMMVAMADAGVSDLDRYVVGAERAALELHRP